MTHIDKAEALLPCPFCGGEAETTLGPIPGKWGARCKECDVWRDDREATEADAIAAWNRRAALPARGVGVKALVWEPHWTGGQEAREFAQVPIGMDYHVNDEGWWQPHSPLYRCVNREAAKAAAQADYEARILTALAPAEVGGVEATDLGKTEGHSAPVDALVKAAEPFAYEIDAPAMEDDRPISVRVTIGDHRRLRAALAAIRGEKP